jgi:hypothetical protein
MIWPAPIGGDEPFADILEFNICVEPPFRSEPPVFGTGRAEEVSSDCAARLCLRNALLNAELPAFTPGIEFAGVRTETCDIAEATNLFDFQLLPVIAILVLGLT